MNLQKLHRIMLGCLLMLFLFSTKGTAQLSYGFKYATGLNLTHSESYGNKSNALFLTMGLGALLSMPLTEELSLQAELNYLTNPGAIFYYNSLALPVLAVYKFTPRLSAEAGPSLQRDFVRSDSRFATNLSPYINVGLNAGASYWLDEHLFVNLRYTFELFRTKYDMRNFFANDPTDPLILSNENAPSFRDTFITGSIVYIIK